jgi:hypothetical protein
MPRTVSERAATRMQPAVACGTDPNLFMAALNHPGGVVGSALRLGHSASQHGRRRVANDGPLILANRANLFKFARVEPLRRAELLFDKITWAHRSPRVDDEHLLGSQMNRLSLFVFDPILKFDECGH